MKTDIQIQNDVMDELKWQPSLHSSEIGVAVKSGILTLSGTVDCYAKKLIAENAAKRISGVKALAEDIRIGVSPSFAKTDTEIAEAVVNALKWHSSVPEEKVKIKVENGIVTLEGQLNWAYQRANAKAAIENLLGVRLVINMITVKPKVDAFQLDQQIAAAFRRNAAVDAGGISITASGNKVILQGHVRSVAESEDAQDVAWAAPGVGDVDNRLIVDEPQLVN